MTKPASRSKRRFQHVVIESNLYHGRHSHRGMAGATTISLRRETKDLLRKLRSKGQTYDEVIWELIETASIKELDSRWNQIIEDEEFIQLDEL